MQLVVGFLLAIFSLAKAEEDWSKIFPNHLPNPAGIRIPHGIPSPKITGGQEAEPHSIPYQVALLIYLSRGTAFCGGSLITNRTVLTAAHCVDDATGGVTIIFGAHNVNADEPTQLRVNATHIIIHPSWSSLLIRNDIALLRFDPIEFNEYIQPIRYANDPDNSFEGHYARVSGWGLDSDNATTISPVLRQVTIPIISNERCNVAYVGVIQDTHICASGLGGRSTCSGDSGGPLTVAGVQVGIVSFGISLGCEIGWPPAFTRVTSFAPWIDYYA